MYKTEIIHAQRKTTSFMDLLVKHKPDLARESAVRYPLIWTEYNKHSHELNLMDAITVGSVPRFITYMKNLKYGNQRISWRRWGLYPVNTSFDYIVSDRMNFTFDWEIMFLDNGYKVPEWAIEFVSSIDSESDMDKLKLHHQNIFFASIETCFSSQRNLSENQFSRIKDGLLSYACDRYSRRIINNNGNSESLEINYEPEQSIFLNLCEEKRSRRHYQYLMGRELQG